MSLRKTVVLAFCLFLYGPHLSLQAGVHEDYVLEQYLSSLTEEVNSIKIGGSKSKENIGRLHIAYFDALKRIEVLTRTKQLGQAVADPVLIYLRDTHVPALKQLYSDWSLKPDPKPYADKTSELRGEISKTEAALIETYKRIRGRHPAVKQIMQFLALARSETLADGTIGKWNPDSPDAIQLSALEGMRNVVSQMDKPENANSPITIDQLLKYQATMLGKAAHFYSQPGRINDIVFNQADGKKVHVKEYLAKWEESVAKSRAGLMSANEAYWEFLHLHPFGDANGRVADLARQAILEKAGLPPMITREKTATENYKYQRIFGEGLNSSEHLALAREASNFLEGIEEVLGHDATIVGVDLAGGNVVVEVEKGVHKRVLVINRTYTVPVNAKLPPVTGSPVIVGKPEGEVTMRVTMNDWKSQEDVKPKKVLKTTREGTVGVTYSIYDVEVPSTRADHRSRFAFFYDHTNGSRVWFNNNNKNYLAVTSPRGLCGDLEWRHRPQ